MRLNRSFAFCLLVFLIACTQSTEPDNAFTTISRSGYHDKLEGFWLGQCIANWTGLVTEMDKVGNVGEIQTGPFYTREDWGGPDLPNIWSELPSDLSPTIDFVFREEGEVWGADDDTDLEYMYQYLTLHSTKVILSPSEIREGWLKHIKKEEENFLWVSNQTAFDLMREGMEPPNTSDPASNPHFEMIDAQLTTEIFGLFAPSNPKIALQLSELPIRTTARDNAAYISEFYVIMHSLAHQIDPNGDMKRQTIWLADQARKHLPDSSYSAKMYDFVLDAYQTGVSWEEARDGLYERYQVHQMDGYDITSRNLHCNGCFAAGINFGAGMVSWFYGEGSLKETIKIGVLAGWDSDNPTATWGGLLGFIYGKENIEEIFQKEFSDRYDIHRTRQGFPKGIDTFEAMANDGLIIIDRVVEQLLNGETDLDNGEWKFPKNNDYE